MKKLTSEDVDKILKIKTPEQLFALIENEITFFFEISYLAIFILNNDETEYVLRKQIFRAKDMPGVARDTKLVLKDSIVTHLLATKKPILLKEVRVNLEVALTPDRQKFLSLLRNRLLKLKAELCVPGLENDKLVAIFVLGKKISKEEFSVQEVELFSSLVEQFAKVVYNFGLLRKEIEFFVSSIRKINNDLEAKDPYTAGHSYRVARFSMVVGKKFQNEISKIPYGEMLLYYTAELHDVGKINLSDRILKKKCSLDEQEYNAVKKHPFESAKIIAPLEKWFGRTIIDTVLCHHENYDGTGYPYGKKGEEVNILARIIRVADSFDAMITDRPYRKALVHHEVLSELKKGRGTLYDPKVVDAFLEAYREGLFKDIFFSQLESRLEDRKG